MISGLTMSCPHIADCVARTIGGESDEAEVNIGDWIIIPIKYDKRTWMNGVLVIAACGVLLEDGRREACFFPANSNGFIHTGTVGLNDHDFRETGCVYSYTFKDGFHT